MEARIGVYNSFFRGTAIPRGDNECGSIDHIASAKRFLEQCNFDGYIIAYYLPKLKRSKKFERMLGNFPHIDKSCQK